MSSRKQTEKYYLYACVTLSVAILVCLVFQVVSIVSINASRTGDAEVMLPFDISLPLLFILGMAAVAVGARAFGSMTKPSKWSDTRNGWVFFSTICLGVFSALVTLVLLSPFLVS